MTIHAEKKSTNFQLGDLIKGHFDNDFVFTFTRAINCKEQFLGDGPQFFKVDTGLIVDIIQTPESFYSQSFCKLLLKSGKIGWLPKGWLIIVANINA